MVRSLKRVALLLTVVLLGAAVCWGCETKTKASQPSRPTTPTLRLYLLGGAAGAIEPCGCVKDMLGGVDHAAAYLAAQHESAPVHLVLGAGPMFFSDPMLDEKHRTQALYKAEALAASFKDIGLAAWAPGANDWALGGEQLSKLQAESGAALLGGNLKDEKVRATSTEVVERGGVPIGLAGVAMPTLRGSPPEGVTMSDAAAALKKSLSALTAKAKIRVALISAKRGDALRLAERVQGFQVMLVGKPFDEGEQNDPVTSPTVVGNTLVVQAPNHLQAMAVVDLYLRDGDTTFEDGSGLDRLEKQQSLDQRIDELKRRLDEAKGNGARQADIVAGRRDLEKLMKERERLAPQEPPEQGSFFFYELVKVREALGADTKVTARLRAYYQRVNEHNREVFKDKKPEPPGPDQSGYLGVKSCGSCHIEELEFWKKTRHSHAYEVLAKDHKQFNLDCVSCHVTGYERPGGSTVTHVEGLKSVQCEICHGPGSRHVENPANPDWIQKAPPQTLCAQSCHHPPHVHDDWDVKKAWNGIVGPGHGK